IPASSDDRHRRPFVRRAAEAAVRREPPGSARARETRRQSCLTYHGLDAHGNAQRPTMDAALLVLRLLPPPTTRANIFARLDGARARRAADAGIAAVVQRIVGNAMRA